MDESTKLLLLRAIFPLVAGGFLLLVKFKSRNQPPEVAKAWRSISIGGQLICGGGALAIYLGWIRLDDLVGIVGSTFVLFGILRSGQPSGD